MMLSVQWKAPDKLYSDVPPFLRAGTLLLLPLRTGKRSGLI
jgi:hypothetical protein